jgi:hypothetical protein
VNDAADLNAWLLVELAVCAGCGDLLTPRTQAAECRFYGCRCADVVDANDLEDAVAEVVVDHLIARMVPLLFTARQVRGVWRRAGPAGQRALITTELVSVTVTHADGQFQMASV